MSGQDWLEKDFYAALGVAKDADDAALKKAYRKLARQYHPDQNAGDAAAETKFKEIGEAYSVLSDPEQRKQYDAIRAMAGGGPRFAAGGSSGAAGFEDLFGGMFSGGGAPGGAQFSGGGFEDVLSGMFGGGGRGGPAGFRAGPRPQQGADISATTTLDFRSAVEGTTLTLDVGGRKINARFPAGVRDGQKIRMRGKGQPGSGGGPAGDLNVTVRVTPHPVFTMDGVNLRVNVPITFPEATLGTQIEVPTFDGATVKLKVAEGTPSGRVLRVKGRGVKTAKATGDLLVTVNVVVPQKLDKKARAAVEEFAELTNGTDVRAELLARAGE